MNIIDEYKYKELCHILSGCRTILDAHNFVEIYTKKNPEMKKIAYSLTHGKRYESVLDFKSIKNTIESINECNNKDIANNIVNSCDKNTDFIQKKCLSRIVKNKASKPMNQIIKNNSALTNYENLSKKSINKKCPHCNHICIGNIDTTYVICGYPVLGNKPYDYVGCCRDWCFKCEKILCKSWDKDELCLTMNRFHDKECCKKHSLENKLNKKYPDDYCQCKNSYVNRFINNTNFGLDFDLN